jgi:hypothetical protein
MIRGLVVAALFAAAPAFAQTAATGKFKRDPFDWTSLQQAVQKREPEAAKVAAAPPARLPRLRAVMRGPSGGQVNLDGVIMGIGDSAEGYRLVEVREYSAVFARKGGTVELEVSREQAQ